MSRRQAKLGFRSMHVGIPLVYQFRRRTVAIAALILLSGFAFPGSVLGHDVDDTLAETLNELTQTRNAHPDRSHAFDIEAQLVFETREWNRFRVIEGLRSDWCVAPTEYRQRLMGARLGDRLRIRGTSSPNTTILNCTYVELLGRGDVDSLMTVPAIDGGVANLSRYVVHTGVVKNVFVSPRLIRLDLKDPQRLLSIYVGFAMPIEELRTLLGATVTVTGVMETNPQASPLSESPVRILSMSPEQLQIQEPADPASIQQRKYETGQITYIGEDYVLTDGSRIQTIDSPRLQVGGRIEYSVTPTDSNEPGGEAKWISTGLASTFPAAVATRASDIIDRELMFHRVRTQGRVRSIDFSDHAAQLKLDDEGTNFSAWITPRNLAVPIREQFSGIEAGDWVQLTGTVDSPTALQTGEPFLLRIDRTSDIVVASRLVQLESRTVALMLLGFGALASTAFFWQRSLRHQVRMATEELRSLNARIMAATRAVRDGILVLDLDNRVAQVDEDIQAIFGNQIAVGDGADRTLRCVLLSRFADSQDFHEFWDQSFRDPTLTAAREFQSVHPTGWLSVYTAPVVDTNDRHLGRIVTFEDISKKKQIEEEYLQSQKISAIGRLAGGVAHDFNNALQVIGARLELLSSLGADDDRIREHSQAATMAVDKASEMNRQLLTFSRRTTIESKTLCTANLIQETAEMLRNTFQANINFRVSIAPDLWPVESNAAQLQQVLINLCFNARDAAKHAVGTIELSAINTVREGIGECVQISVTDDGVGIAAETLRHVFEPFFTTKAVGEGTGLGLSTSLSVVEQLGGRMTCQSDLGKGTRMDVHLPRSKRSVEEVPIESAKPQPTAARSQRILLVDDDEAVRKSTSLLLTNLGHEAHVANGGKQTLSILEDDSNFDFILLDLTMPDMSGRETLIEIRRRLPDMRVIICSGFSDDASHIMETDALRADAFLSKPFRIRDFQKLIDSLASLDQSIA
ncbi:hybrid sensor histidine kinase/response regulator [Rubripirellula lacrimiformis]|nr:ATP-binding protein [Rubripirellula lacrimiformis]